MKKLLVAAFMLLCTSGLFAELAYIQPTFGIGAAFSGYGSYSEYGYKSPEIWGNQFGITVGADVDWSVWQNDGDGAGDLLVGMDLAFEYWVPTKHKYGNEANHIMRLPLQANIAYEFQVNAGPLEAVGPWFSMGLGLNFITGPEELKDADTDRKFQATFRWGIGASLAFANNFALKVGFGGDAGETKEMWGWNQNSFFMVEGAYRF